MKSRQPNWVQPPCRCGKGEQHQEFCAAYGEQTDLNRARGLRRAVDAEQRVAAEQQPACGAQRPVAVAPSCFLMRKCCPVLIRERRRPKCCRRRRRHCLLACGSFLCLLPLVAAAPFSSQATHGKENGGRVITKLFRLAVFPSLGMFTCFHVSLVTFFFLAED